MGSDRASKAETIRTQVQRVTARTNKSHVSTFGDASFENEPFGDFEYRGNSSLGFAGSIHDAVNVRDIPLQLAYHLWEAATDEIKKSAAFRQLQEVVVGRKADENVFDSIAEKACSNGSYGCSHNLKNVRSDLKDLQCHK